MTNILSESQVKKNWKQNNAPLVSITCICYNHERYISQAVEGFLNQKTDFPFEIIIFDDASSDNTQAIIKEYADRCPTVIRTILQTENLWLGKGINGTTTIVWPSAKGKYIAWCEGDDYWTDPYKLQKQVDFLEKNTDFKGIHTKVMYVDKSNNVLGYSDRVKPSFEEISFEALIQRNIIHTCSFMFLRDAFLFNGKYYWELTPTFHDIYLFLCVSLSGKIKYLNETTAVYRTNVGIMQTLAKESILTDAIKYHHFFLNLEILGKNQIASILLSLINRRIDLISLLGRSNRRDAGIENLRTLYHEWRQYKKFKKYLKIVRIKISIKKWLLMFLWLFLPNSINYTSKAYNKLYNVFNR